MRGVGGVPRYLLHDGVGLAFVQAAARPLPVQRRAHQVHVLARHLRRVAAVHRGAGRPPRVVRRAHVQRAEGVLLQHHARVKNAAQLHHRVQHARDGVRRAHRLHQLVHQSLAHLRRGAARADQPNPGLRQVRGREGRKRCERRLRDRALGGCLDGAAAHGAGHGHDPEGDERFRRRTGRSRRGKRRELGRRLFGVLRLGSTRGSNRDV